MNTTSKRYLGIAAGFALAIGVATAVFAQGGSGMGSDSGPCFQHGMMRGSGAMHNQSGGPGHMMGMPGGMQGRGGGSGWMMGGDPVANADQYLVGLKAELEITSEQEEIWIAYEDAVRGKAAMMSSHQESMHGSGPMTTEQRLAFHERGLEQMQSVLSASRDLHATLTPEQQSSAGDLFAFHHGRR